MIEDFLNIYISCVACVLLYIGIHAMAEECLPLRSLKRDARAAFSFLLLVFAPVSVLYVLVRLAALLGRSFVALVYSFGALYRMKFPAKVVLPKAKAVR